MGTNIDEYERKRDFGKTPEPEPGRGDARAAAPVFVVHRHDATRLHYDLRLEMEGVLRSWAIPKGFSYDPDEKHLAVRTEDHPLEYEHFSGVIPKGQYGAGTMTIWDHGHYRVVKAASASDAVAAGELKVILSGRKLRGEWHLVRTKQGPNTWLLFKSKDRYAGIARDTALGIDLADATRAPLPEDVEPMRTGGRREPFSDPAWVFEMGFVGRRVLAWKFGETAGIRGVEGQDALRAELLGVRAEQALLDGVLVAPDEHGRPSEACLVERLAGRDDGPVMLYVFDLLYYDEFDLRQLTLLDRKAALRTVIPDSDCLLYVDHVPGSGEALVGAIRQAGLPEAIAKRGSSRYVSGPSADWCSLAVDPDSAVADLPVAQAIPRGGGSRAARVPYTNLDKVYWPADGFTKADLIHYYEQFADVLLPYLADRPLHMHRFPDGIDGKSFYQKDVQSLVPDWVATCEVTSSRKEAPGRYVVCNDRDTLMLLANLGSIDLHPWMSRRESPESPDYAVIDLDPKDAPFVHVVEIAQHVGNLLVEIGLRPLLKTSGKTGLHIHIPLAPGYSYDQARMFCEGIARIVARDLPQIATVERATKNREGRVYVDFGQNRMQQTIVPPYVVRPVRGATVSAPLAWDELVPTLTPDRFTIQTMAARIAAASDLFAPLLTDRQDLLPAIEKLQSLLAR